MADSFWALADMVKINDKNLAPFEASNILNDAPVVRRLAAIPASKGTDHMVITETTAPTVGFRSVNDGRENSESADTVTTLNLKILDASFAIDLALANSYAKGVDAMIQREGMRALRAALFQAEKQVFYGTGNDSGGFAGLTDNANYNGLSDTMIVNAGGSTALTSVWLLRTTDEALALVLGNDGNIEMGDTVIQRISGATTGTYPAYYTPVTGWMALQIPSTYDACRICNLDAGSNTLTDDLIASAIQKFPASRPPNLICMNRRSLGQLQNSRTATNPTGAPAPFPESAFNIPIAVTDALGIAETAVS